MSPSHGMEVGGEGSVGAVRPDAGQRRSRVHLRPPSLALTLASTDMPGTKRSAETIRIVNDDLHRDALHDLGEVARGVVGRQQREHGARGRRECQHMSAQCMPREGVDGDFRLLPDGHVSQLRFLVVGDDPYVRQGREGRDLTAHAHQLPGFDLALSDHAVLSRRDGGVPDIELGRIECCALRGDRRPRSARFALQGPRAGARRRAPGRGFASAAPRVAHGWWPAFRSPRWKRIRSRAVGAALQGRGHSVRKTRWWTLLPHVPPRHSRAAAHAAP